jgi:SAM-dependent methyltransferase
MAAVYDSQGKVVFQTNFQTMQLLRRVVEEDEFNDAAQNEAVYDGGVSQQEELIELLGYTSAVGYTSAGPHKFVLDIGCGSLTDPVLSKLVTHGLEPSPSRLPTKDKIVIRSGYAEAIPYEDALFDVIISWGVMCFVRSDMEAMVEVNRSLTMHGRFVMDVVAESTLSICRTVHPRSYRRWMENFGFTTVVEKPLESPPYHKRVGFVLEKVAEFKPEFLRAPQAIGGVRNFVPERDWYLK